jgi:hypothetical protein
MFDHYQLGLPILSWEDMTKPLKILKNKAKNTTLPRIYTLKVKFLKSETKIIWI